MTTGSTLTEEFLALNENDQKLIIFLYEWGRPLRPGVAADYLNINHSTLSLSIERLIKREIVFWERYKLVKLLLKGKEMAAHQLNHHEVIHQYLVENLDLTNEEAHEESMNVAGIFSCRTVEKMKQKIDKNFEPKCSLIVME